MFFYIWSLKIFKNMASTTHLYLCAFLLVTVPTISQNLLNTSTWTVGSGSVSGFSKIGETSENIFYAQKYISIHTGGLHFTESAK